MSPHTVDSIVANHKAASALRAAGRPAWAMTLRIKDVIADETMSFEDKRTALAARISAHRWYTSQDRSGYLDVVVDDIRDANDVEDLDHALDDLYDLADADRVWID